MRRIEWLFRLLLISKVVGILDAKENITLAYIGTHSGLISHREGESASGAMTHAVNTVNADPTLLQNYTLTYLFADNEDSSLRSIEVVTELWSLGAVAFFGPEDSCFTEARVAAAWNLPMISHKCVDARVSDKSEFPTFARTQSPSSTSARSVIALLQYYGWSKFAIIIEDIEEYIRTAATLDQLAVDINMTVTKTEQLTGPFSDIANHGELVPIIKRTYIHTRIYVVLASKTAFLPFAREMALFEEIESDDYVLIGVRDAHIYDPTNTLEAMFTDVETGVASRTNASVQAFSNVLQLVGTPPTNPDYETVWKDKVRKYLYEPPINMPPLNPFLVLLGYKALISVFAAYLYDAVLVYARALDEVLQNGGPASDGKAIFQRIAGRSYPSILGYDVFIDKNGDAQSNLSVVALLADNNRHGYGMKIAGQFFITDGTSGKLVFSESVAVYDTIPKDEPVCGFYDEKCQPEPDYTAEIVGGVLGGITFIILVIALILYRNWRYEQQLASLLWKINIHEIDFRQEALMSSSFSMGSNQFETGSITGSHEGSIRSLRSKRGQIFTKTGLYKGNIVALKWIRKRHVDMKRNVRLELKQMKDIRHDHVVEFIGACVDPPCLTIVSEYCQRGSLEDVLESEDIKIDKILKSSLIADIMKGMVYIHCSDIKSHGNLKSPNCLINSRWVLKVADFGLHHFKSRQEDVDDGEYAHYKQKLWTAPELLRNKCPPMGGTQKGDMYSFGIILFEIEGRSGPFGDKDLSPKEIVEQVRLGSNFRPDITSLACPAFIVETMSLCWSEDVIERPDFKKCRQLLKPMQKGLKSNIFDNMMTIMERYASNLESLVVERTGELMEEKKKTDSLLHRMLPTSVAEQLKQGKLVEPETFDCVTIYFSDICGFTALSAISTPLQVVDLLNDLYTCFDSIIQNYDVYKVETIGDAYMVVSGLPKRNGKNHAGEIASMSLNLLRDIKKFKIRHRPDYMLKLRIGIHSGSCVAGVVGLTMPRYCLFGDTVNTASRMESNGEALRIHVSPECCGILEELGGYELEKRGLVAMKGKGEISTFWLNDEDSNVRQRRIRHSVDSGLVTEWETGSEPRPESESRPVEQIKHTPLDFETMPSSKKQDVMLKNETAVMKLMREKFAFQPPEPPLYGNIENKSIDGIDMAVLDLTKDDETTTNASECGQISEPVTKQTTQDALQRSCTSPASHAESSDMDLTYQISGLENIEVTSTDNTSPGKNLRDSRKIRVNSFMEANNTDDAITTVSVDV